MRQRMTGGWFFRLTFAMPIAAVVILLSMLGILGIADLCGGGAWCDTLWKVFLYTAGGLLGLAFLIRVSVFIAAVIGVFILTMQRTMHGASLLIRAALRGM